MHDPVHDQEEIAPRDQGFAIHAQAQDGVGAAADEELVDAVFPGNLLVWLLGVDDGQRHKDGPRPRRDFVNVEVEPVGKENDLRRDGRDGIVVVLAQRAEVHLGEGVARHHAAMSQNPLAALRQARIVGPDAHELGREIALHRERDVARAAGIEAPASVVVLVAHHLAAGALQTARIAALEQGVEEDVVGLEHRIGFEFAAPVAVRMLPGQDVVRRPADGGLDISQVRIQAPEFRRAIWGRFGSFPAVKSCVPKCLRSSQYSRLLQLRPKRCRAATILTRIPGEPIHLNDKLDADEPTDSANRNRFAAPRSANGLNDLRRQAKTHILRHHFYFFDALETRFDANNSLRPRPGSPAPMRRP